MPVETTNTPVIDLGSGTLYMTPLDGGHPVCLGRVSEAAQTVERTDYLDELGVSSPVVAPSTESVTFECMIKPEDINLVALWRLTHDMRVALCWAQENTPKLLHLATYAKTHRKRWKNIGRIVRAFFEEVQNHEKK